MLNRTFRDLVTSAACAFALGALTHALPVAAQISNTGAFRNLTAIESTLRRGLTTKAEVRQQLGIPNGSGAWRLAHYGNEENEIWYYEDIELTATKPAQEGIKMDLRQQILLVLFKGEVVDGYLWTSNSGTGATR